MRKSNIVAGEVDAYCTKCRLDLTHRIIAMEGDRIARVECLTCRGHHNYRKPASAPGPASERRRGAKAGGPGGAAKSARPKVDSARVTWEKATLGRVAQEFSPYAPAARFSVGQLVRHAKFGEGVVTEALTGDKIQVLFADGAKLLVHGRG